MIESEDHFRQIERAVTSGHSDETGAWRTSSWARCLRNYRLDPMRPDLVQLTEGETRRAIEGFDSDLNVANQELEKTLLMIEGGGYSAHVTDADGVIISERRSADQTYYCSMDRIGSVWSEDVGGTNGIGTSLLTRKPTAVYLTDHFYAGMTGQACAASPFFGPDGELKGTINLSTRNPGVPKLAHRVVYGIAQVTAERIETQYFRRAFGKFHTLHIERMGHSPEIFAIDDDYRIVGATRAARDRFRVDPDAVGKRSLWSLFEKLRGNPNFTYLRDNLRQVRPLGESNTVTAFLMQPQSAIPSTSQPRPVIVQKRAPEKAAADKGLTLDELAGTDVAMNRAVRLLRKMIGSGLHILILGETGTGKDTVARALHCESDRTGGAFVAFNCAAVPESLIDSELFGYSAGAFTGASKEGNIGRIAEADRGTLFLDEIGDMPLALQTRLLRFLETQDVTPLGGGKSRTVDVQVIAATHQNLRDRVAKGTFRQDLYYRLAGVTVELPPLRQRESLTEVFDTVLRHLREGGDKELDAAAVQLLVSHDWPGNIRELRNVLARAARLADGSLITADDVQIDRMVESSAMDPSERARLVAAIQSADGDAEACAAMFGCSRATLYRKLKAFGLTLK